MRICDCIVAGALLFATAPFAKADPVTRLYQRGYNAYHALDYATAVKCWSDVLALDPKDAAALKNRAEAYLMLKEWDKAAADATAEIALTPDDPAAYELRGDIYHEKRRALISKPGTTVHREPDEVPDAEQAIADYTETLRLGIPRGMKPGDWMMWGGTRSVGYNGEREIAAANVKLAADPGDKQLLMTRAFQYQQMWEWDKAIADDDAVLKLDPGNARALEQRAQLNASKQWSSSKPQPDAVTKQLADLTEIIRLKPVSGNYVRRGEVYERVGDYDKAMADYQQALTLSNGKDNGAWGGISDIQAAGGEWAKAIESYNHLIDSKDYGDYTNHYMIYNDRASLYLNAGEYDKSIADVNMVMEGERQALEETRKMYRDEEAQTASREAREDADQPPRPDQLKFRADEAKSRKERHERDEQYTRGWMATYLVERGEAWLRAGNYEKALADFDSGIAADAIGTRAPAAKAWMLATCADAKFRGGAKAVELALKACALGWWAKPGDIDTLAAACAEAGKWDDAVNYENMAVKVAADESAMPEHNAAAEKQHVELVKSYQARLALYQQKKQFRGVKELVDWED